MGKVDERQATISEEVKEIPVGKISYEEFLEWVDEDTYAEWVDGDVVMSSPASYRHQNIKGFLESVIRPFVEIFDLGMVVSAGFQMKLPTSGREPDLLFVSKAKLGQVQNNYLDGPADLAVEIVSPESVERDRVTKLAEYATGRVGEYWVIDPTTEQASFYRLDESGQYVAVAIDEQGRYYSGMLAGFWLQVDWLWRKRLPEVHKVLLKVGGAAYREYLERLSQDEEI